MNTLPEAFKEKNLTGAFLDIGIKYKGLFPGGFINTASEIYKNYEWVVKTVPGYNRVINAVPPDINMKSFPWEEWFLLDGKTYHHVLYLKEPAQYDEIFNAPSIDDIHPARVLGRKWYVIDDPDMSLVLLRGNP